MVNLRLGDPDAASCGPAWENSCVAIALDWIARNFVQADLVVERRSGDDWERVPDHPLISLLDDPIPDHPAFDYFALWSSALLSLLVDGNGYWYKGRDRIGAVRELWPINHAWVEPFRRSPSAPDYLYRYRVPVERRVEVIDRRRARLDDHLHFGALERPVTFLPMRPPARNRRIAQQHPICAQPIGFSAERQVFHAYGGTDRGDRASVEV